MKFAEKLAISATDFKASNGWLQRFKSRHFIVAVVSSGEKASVNAEVVQEWQNHLSSLFKDYEPRKYFQLWRNWAFFRPDLSLVSANEERAGEKRENKE